MGFKLDQSLDKRTKDHDRKEGLDHWLKKEITIFGSFFNSKKKEGFYGELAILVKAGLQLREALELLAGNQKKEKLKVFYRQMVVELDQGLGFSEVLKKRKEFTEYEYYSVEIGEESGNLSQVLHELATFFLQKNEQRRNLVNALTYPSIIICTAILVVVFMLRMVVPMFKDIFEQNDVELPAITQWVIAVSNSIERYGVFLILVIAVMIMLRKPLGRMEYFKRKWDYLILRVPYMGNFMRLVYMAQFTQAVSLLTTSKVPMLNSIQMARKMLKFFPVQDALDTMEVRILQGISLHQSLMGNDVFDHKMISLVKVAEETNQTEYIFKKLNEQYVVELQQKSKMLSTIMEPLIIVIIGFFVGVILVSMYLPMFRLSSVLGG